MPNCVSASLAGRRVYISARPPPPTAIRTDHHCPASPHKHACPPCTPVSSPAHANDSAPQMKVHQPTYHQKSCENPKRLSLCLRVLPPLSVLSPKRDYPRRRY